MLLVEFCSVLFGCFSNIFLKYLSHTLVKSSMSSPYTVQHSTSIVPAVVCRFISILYKMSIASVLCPNQIWVESVMSLHSVQQSVYSFYFLCIIDVSPSFLGSQWQVSAWYPCHLSVAFHIKHHAFSYVWCMGITHMFSFVPCNCYDLGIFDNIALVSLPIWLKLTFAVVIKILSQEIIQLNCILSHNDLRSDCRHSCF